MLVEAFWASMSKPSENGCWEWKRCINNRYGMVSYEGKLMGSHRLAAQLSGMEIAGKTVCHKCDNPICCNPRHLFVADQAANMLDMARKKRSKCQKQTACIKGHALTTENTRLVINRKSKLEPWRACRICIRAARAKKKQKDKLAKARGEA